MLMTTRKGAVAALTLAACLNLVAVAQTDGETGAVAAPADIEAETETAPAAIEDSAESAAVLPAETASIAEAATPAPAVVKSADILLMPPDAKVMFITPGGAEMRADWSEAARDNFRTHMITNLYAAGQSIVHFDPAHTEREPELSQLLLLWEVVSASTGTPMPHKGKKLDSNAKLTLGKSAQKLADAYGADKAAFVNHYSQIESGGVFLAQVMIGAATGYVPASANMRATTTRIVDLQTGDIISTSTVAGGDPRDVEESQGITSRMMKSISLN
jgi:hypothetical protein